MKEINRNDYKLCYVHGNKAYFTSDDLSEAWWNDWISDPTLNRKGLIHKDETKNVIPVYFEIPGDNIFYSDPKKATFTAQADIPWFSYWAVGEIEERIATVLVEVFSGTPLDIFINTIIDDGGLIYEMTSK